MSSVTSARIAIAIVVIVSHMLRHIVLLGLSDDAGEEEIAAMKTSLGDLRSVIPEILAYNVSEDVGISEGNATVAIVGDFADEDAYQVYARHPAHLEVIAEKIAPYVTSRSAVQVRVG